MSFNPAESAAFDRLAALALAEDLDSAGDVTSLAIIGADLQGKAALVARSAGVLAGLPAAEGIFAHVDPSLQFAAHLRDGAALQKDTIIATVSGPLRSILTAERTALNFVQRLSGVATLTRRYADLVRDLPCRVLDTRKTTPGWRLLEKYAVRMGGGHNHRLGLYDGILIKDNHLAGLRPGEPSRVSGGVASAISQAVSRARAAFPALPIEIEVDTLEQLEAALAQRLAIVLLDNMTLAELRQAVARRNAAAPEVLLEASGGVTLETVRAIAETGVDRISVGALTHSAPALDIALDYLA
jgi:nicotinate-nucleotide pyrophosphorylase (carboxylating)